MELESQSPTPMPRPASGGRDRAPGDLRELHNVKVVATFFFLASWMYLLAADRLELNPAWLTTRTWVGIALGIHVLWIALWTVYLFAGSESRWEPLRERLKQASVLCFIISLGLSAALLVMLIQLEIPGVPSEVGDDLYEYTPS